MTNTLIQVDENFWNIRGSFKIAGVLDVGTHCSLVRLAGGGFVFLDSYTLEGAAAEQVAELTDGGAEVRAILNLHPFHTVHVGNMHEAFPNAALYGSDRHRKKAPDLPWEETNIETEAAQSVFEADLDFSVPRGVDYISANENVHFSSVLAYHRASKTIHSDDTFNYIGAGSLLRFVGKGDSLSFHPTLDKALEKRAGAGADFSDWARELIMAWGDAENVCAAHMATLLGSENQGASVKERMQSALEAVQSVLDRHDRNNRG